LLIIKETVNTVNIVWDGKMKVMGKDIIFAMKIAKMENYGN